MKNLMTIAAGYVPALKLRRKRKKARKGARRGTLYVMDLGEA